MYFEIKEYEYEGYITFHIWRTKESGRLELVWESKTYADALKVVDLLKAGTPMLDICKQQLGIPPAFSEYEEEVHNALGHPPHETGWPK